MSNVDCPREGDGSQENSSPAGAGMVGRKSLTKQTDTLPIFKKYESMLSIARFPLTSPEVSIANEIYVEALEEMRAEAARGEPPPSFSKNYGKQVLDERRATAIVSLALGADYDGPTPAIFAEVHETCAEKTQGGLTTHKDNINGGNQVALCVYFGDFTGGELIIHEDHDGRPVRRPIDTAPIGGLHQCVKMGGEIVHEPLYPTKGTRVCVVFHVDMTGEIYH
jgi:hypothetical protein